ncbi:MULTISPECIES: NAD(P)/FAD-dependent oxidoreductase [Halorussus]|uniref:NAD(P)/FAD-dependent oxidoreductase n=1 Tax=Halorussus TaxID=1070314 RepID=UPI000E2180C6|nr:MULTISPECIES: NAD(P)/FAD-dependent oxidoreductase [Halorussus]NHN58020.1 NAD(P)/FAD-dependent oxidoreductase [Halorussus sp. JP-T4]
MTEVVVAGGGPAGLVAARHLADAGADVRLYERHHDLGGRVRSLRRDGYVFDRGFQVLFTAYPAARRELDYDALDLRYFKPGAVVAREGERATLADPFRDLDAALETLLNREVTLRDKLRVLELRRELAGKPDREIFAGPDATTREYLREREFSDQFVENFAAPFFGGVTLDRSLGTSKRAFEFAFKMLATGRIAVPARGMAAVTEQLAESAREAGVDLVTDETVTELDPHAADPGVELGRDETTADVVVVATDPKEARDLTGVESIPTDAKGCVTQYYAFDGPALDAGARLLLNAEDDAPNHVAQLSAVAPEYAPEDRNMLSATFLGVPGESDEELAAKTARALDAWYPERRLDLDRLHTSRVEFAQFAQPPGIHERLPDVRAPDGPVYLAGEYTDASSLNAAMLSGQTAAKRVAEDFDLEE